MTSEEKQLLLKDLYGRFSSEIQCKIDLQGILDFFDEYREKFEVAQNISSNLFDTVSGRNYTLYGFPCPDRVTLLEFDGLEDYGIPVEFIKPYLRPMNTMTDEEFKEYHNMLDEVDKSGLMCQKLITQIVDWLDKKLFDHRGLIPKGLALEAPEDLYKTE